MEDYEVYSLLILDKFPYMKNIIRQKKTPILVEPLCIFYFPEKTSSGQNKKYYGSHNQCLYLYK